MKVSKKAKIRTQYNQAQHLAQEPRGKVTKTQETSHTRELLSQEVSPFPACDHKAAMNRQESMTITKQK